MSQPLRFGPFELHAEGRQLLMRGEPVALGGRALDVLRVLVERADRPVSKSELLDCVWPGRDVEEGNLAVQISALRKLLGPEAINTVPGRGYRFVWGSPPAPEEPGAASGADATRPGHRLPPRQPELIGRADELLRLLQALPGQQVLSLIGASGIGKTSLALAVAHAATAHFGDDVAWVDLADLAQEDRLVLRVAAAVGLAADRAADPRATLLAGLRRRRMLVVLDNCEHLVGAVAHLVGEAVAVAPQVHWLITSQEPLKLPGEQVWRLDVLAVPPTGTPWPEALRYGALALLCERARASNLRFALGPASVAAAIEICQRLDGVPLALEMAAARLPWMGVEGVRSRLDDALRMLNTDRRSSALRHRSLQAAMAWSHGLLGAKEQIAFRRLALFRGGFKLEALQAVVADGQGLEAWEALDALGALVDKSLVHIQGDLAAPQLRYRLLEAARQFAAARLDEAGETQALAARHAAAFVAMAEQVGQCVWNESDAAWLARIEPELEILRVALEHCVVHRDREGATRLFECMTWVDQMRAGGGEVRHWTARMESLLEGATPLQAGQLQAVLAFGCRNTSPARAAAHSRQALALLGEQATTILRFRMLNTISIAMARQQRSEEAAQALTEALALQQADWPARLRMTSHDAAGFGAIFSGDADAAVVHFNRFRKLALECGAESGVAVVSHNLADIALARGDVDEAVRQGVELVARLRRQRNPYQLGFSLANLGAALLQRGDVDAGARACLEALPMLRREDHATWLFDHFAWLACLRQRAEDAARLLGYGSAVRAAVGSVRDLVERRAHDQSLAHCTAHLGAGLTAALGAEGARWTAEQADAAAERLAPAPAAAVTPGRGPDLTCSSIAP